MADATNIHSVRRAIIGILALMFLTASVVLYIGDDSFSISEQLRGSLVRIGAILAVLWIAYPDLSRLRPASMVAVVIAIVLVLRWPRLLPVVLIGLALFAILKPREKKPQRPVTRA